MSRVPVLQIGKAQAELFDEIIHAEITHPGHEQLFDALVEEVGELAEAILQGDYSHAKLEARQVATVALRLMYGASPEDLKTNSTRVLRNAEALGLEAKSILESNQ